MQTHERADVEKVQGELAAAKAALATAIAEARELEHKVCKHCYRQTLMHTCLPCFIQAFDVALLA